MVCYFESPNIQWLFKLSQWLASLTDVSAVHCSHLFVLWSFQILKEVIHKYSDKAGTCVQFSKWIRDINSRRRKWKMWVLTCWCESKGWHCWKRNEGNQLLSFITTLFLHIYHILSCIHMLLCALWPLIPADIPGPQLWASECWASCWFKSLPGLSEACWAGVTH